MKFTIITVCLNSEKTILYTLNSVLNQTYNNIEHIIVDGGSKDGTLEIIKKYNFKKKKIIYTNLQGIYNAINEGIKNATGEYISVLHSDDVYQNDCIIEDISKIIKQNKKYKIFFGNVVYFSKHISKIKRYYSGYQFTQNHLLNGIIPPHTGTFVNKSIYRKFGNYKTNYLIASDFDFFLRTLFINKIKYFKIDKVITRMKTGGVSGKNIFSYITSTKEITKAFKENKITCSNLKIFLRLPLKLVQFFNFNTKKLNTSYNFKYSKFLKKIEQPDLTIVQNFNKIFLNKNFILSALNLSFLGNYASEKIKIENNLICWPDGYFSKTIDSTLYKVPGREIIRNIKIPKNITEILVFGNLSKNAKNFLKRKFKKKITHINLIHGDINLIIKKTNCRIKKNQLIFLTLPTPKQEIFAQHLAKLNKDYKIICIGGSIAMVSGDEKPVPTILSYFEFLWRLRYETFRRSRRLLVTFYYFIYGKFLSKKLKFENIERL